jgi:6-phosphogluconate dehydrogenase
MLRIPAEPSADAVALDLLPDLARVALITDGGNSHFTDADLRAKTLAEQFSFSGWRVGW